MSIQIRNKQILISFAIIFVIIVIVLGYFIFSKNTSKIKVFDTKEQCETETGSSCIYYLCDIPIGELYQKLCGKGGSGSGWYNSSAIEVK